MNDGAEGASALSLGISGESRGAGEPGGASASRADWARNGIRERLLPEVTRDLFVEAGSGLSRRALAAGAPQAEVEHVLRRADLQSELVMQALIARKGE